MTLPDGWREAAFSELFDLRYGKALPPGRRTEGGVYPVMGSAGEMARSDESLSQNACLVIGRKGNIGAVHLAQRGAWPTDTTFYCEIPQAIDPMFVAHQLEALDLRRLDSSTATPSLRRQDLEAERIVLPNLYEQRRIVEILAEHLSSLDAAVSALRSSAKRATSFQVAAVEEAVLLSRSDVVELRTTLREPMRNGLSAPASLSGTIRILSLTAVTKKQFTERNTKLTSVDVSRAASLWLEPGDVLIQRSNTPELVGTAALYEGEKDWAIFPDLLIRLRPDLAQLRPRFLEIALSMRASRAYFRARARGLSGSMPKIDQGTIAAAPIPLPTLTQQDAIVNRMMTVTERVDTFRRQVAVGERRAAALRRALLQAAFCGQLTGRASDLDRAEELVS